MRARMGQRAAFKPRHAMLRMTGVWAGNKLPPVDGISGEFGDKLEKAKAGSGSEIVTMMGWGSTCPSASASCAPHDLHELSVPVSTQAKCRQVCRSHSVAPTLSLPLARPLCLDPSPDASRRI